MAKKIKYNGISCAFRKADKHYDYGCWKMK